MSDMQFQIRVGNTCKQVTVDGKEKWAWKMFLDGGEQASKIQMVVFRLHETFKNPEVEVRIATSKGVFASPEFTGWGTFEVRITVHWHPTLKSRFGKTTELSHMLSFIAEKTVSTFEVGGHGYNLKISEPLRTYARMFIPVALCVLSLSGEELLSMEDCGEMTCADVTDALESKHPLLPGHEYKLADVKIADVSMIRDAAKGASDLKITAVVQQKASVQEDLNLALIKAAENPDLSRINVLLAAGASAGFVHDPPGTWGDCNTKSALHVAIASLNRDTKDSENQLVFKSIITTLLDAKADVNAERRQSDWRGSGSSSTAFEMVLSAAMQDASLLKAFLAAGANPNTESSRIVASMRSDGGMDHRVLHTAVCSGNYDVVKTLLDARAEVNARRQEKIYNERGYNRDMSETSLHIACKQGDVKMSAMLLAHGADINAVRKDLIVEELTNRTHLKSKCKKVCDDPRDPGYVCPVRCVPVNETAMHIALERKSPSLVALLACSGTDPCVPRRKGDSATSIEELCCGDSSLMNAVAATWPLPADNQWFTEEDLVSVGAAVAASAKEGSPEK